MPNETDKLKNYYSWKIIKYKFIKQLNIMKVLS